MALDLVKNVRICEVGMRDGLQNEKAIAFDANGVPMRDKSGAFIYRDMVDENGNPKVDANGNPVTETKEIYIYNEEDPNDTTKQYTQQSLSVNEALVIDETLLPHLCQNGDVDYALAAKLAGVWDEERLTLNPNDTKACSFKDYYKDMIGEMATYGNVYNSTATSLTGTVASVDNQRQQVIGVSSDEELTYMIKYQNAYNAASRFINVVNEMIEHLLTQLG